MGRFPGWLLGCVIGCAVATSAGCILPVSTGAPLPATTVGKGQIGASISGEAPTLDLLAEGDGYDDLHGAAPAAAMTVTLAYGVGERTDLELAAEGALYFFIVPLPTGGSLGIRHNLAASDLFDVAIAAKVGGVTSSATTGSGTDSSESSASGTYGALQGVLQLKHGWIRPLAAINVMPFRIRRQPTDEAEYRFAGLASSLTLGVMAVGRSAQIGPYFTLTNFESQRFAGGWFSSFGVMVAIRPDRNRPHTPTTSATPYYPPSTPYPSTPTPTVPTGPPGS